MSDTKDIEIIKVASKISDSKLSDSLLASISAINLINNSSCVNYLLDYSDLEIATPLFILPIVVYLDSCDKNITNIKLSDYLNLIKFPNGLQPDKMRKSEFIAIMEQYSKKEYIPIISFPATKEKDNEKDAILSTVEFIIVRQLHIDSNVAMGLNTSWEKL